MRKTIFTSLLTILLVTVQMQAQSSYDSLIQTGNAQLQSGDLNEALEIGQRAIKLAPEKWQAYALTGGALMNLKHYEEAADQFSEGIRLAPETKKAQLRDLRKQCVMAEANIAPPASGLNQSPTPAQTTTQAEVVLWKSIENSESQSDFQTYLNQYPNGAFAGLARTHLDQIQAKDKALREQVAAQEAARAAKEKLEAITFIHAEHVHPGSPNAGILKLSRHGIEFQSPKEAGFSMTCSDIRDIKLQPKYGLNKTPTVRIETKGPTYNFWGDSGDSADLVYAKVKEVCAI